MKRCLNISLIFIGWIILVAMARLPESDIPKQLINFGATVIDDLSVTTKCSSVSWEGQFYFVGNKGKALINIPFEKVKKVVFPEETINGKKDSQVILHNGEVVTVSFDDEARFNGTTTFGTYKILAKNIKEIVFD